MKITAVRPSHAKAWAESLAAGRPWEDGKPLAATTISVRVGQLRTVFQAAVDDDLLAKNPNLRAKRGEAWGEPVEPKAVPDTTQINHLIAAARKGGQDPTVRGIDGWLPPSDWLAQCIILASETGLRPGEVAGLNVGDVDLKKKIIHVQRQCARKVGVDGPLKTVKSDRLVPIGDSLARDLKRWMRGRGPGERVIIATGEGTSSNVMSSEMVKCRRIAGLSERITMHSMRHFFATELLAAGEPLQSVAAPLGHSRISTTEKVYSHFLPSHLDAARGAVGRLGGSLRDGRRPLRAVS